MPPLSTGTRILLPAAAAMTLGAISAGIASADDTVAAPNPSTFDVPGPDAVDQLWALPAPVPDGPPAPEAHAFTEPFTFESPGAELPVTAHGAANGAAPGPAEVDMAPIDAPPRPVILIPAEVGSTPIPAAPEPGKSLHSGAIPVQAVSVADPIGGTTPSRTLVLVSEEPSQHPAVPATAIDKAAVDYSAHPAAAVGDADIVAGLNAAGVAPELTARFTAATRTIIGGESGGSTNAVNRWDSNAWGATQPDGAPHNSSRGPMQTIPGTFAAYHAPGTSTAIYDPVANIAAAWRYIRVQYGVNLATGSGLDAFMARGTGRGVGY
ncbi:transglycosylase SLT domain-containing protein [Mycobacterium dioxanotrophicus]|nr:transglycosylase SLT domain-containing protein [Mycobacterium dioxanotrophicus]